jgi:hypothetical protein
MATAGYPRSVQLIPQGKAKRVLCDPQDSVNILADGGAWSKRLTRGRFKA